MEKQQLRQTLERILQDKVLRMESVGGGDIAQAYLVEQNQKGRVFVKTMGGAGDQLLKESVGLAEMARTGVIAVPRVLYVDRNVLVLEYIENSAARDRLFFRRFGEALAAMHLSFQEKYGFFEDNYIGATPQKNLPEVAYEKSAKNSSHWARFYFENRLLFQFKLLEKKGFTADIQRLFGKMEKRVYELIGEKENEPPALLHGDLWSGNFLASPQVGPVLIDPAVYRGDREADLAMTTLFGGFDAEFYRGYQERYPLDPHYREREGLYHLYHIMNHVNLFGGGYYGQLRSILQRYQ